MLPGSGSDERFIRSVFGFPLAGIGIELVSRLRHVVELTSSPDIVTPSTPSGPARCSWGGISLGAHVAARWASTAQPGRVAGLLLALPAWTGAPSDAPAALTASLTAAHARAGGVAGAVAAAAGAPSWLTAELGRAWAGYGDSLADALEAAAAEPHRRRPSCAASTCRLAWPRWWTTPASPGSGPAVARGAAAVGARDDHDVGLRRGS